MEGHTPDRHRPTWRNFKAREPPRMTHVCGEEDADVARRQDGVCRRELVLPVPIARVERLSEHVLHRRERHCENPRPDRAHGGAGRDSAGAFGEE